MTVQWTRKRVRADLTAGDEHIPCKLHVLGNTTFYTNLGVSPCSEGGDISHRPAPSLLHFPGSSTFGHWIDSGQSIIGMIRSYSEAAS